MAVLPKKIPDPCCSYIERRQRKGERRQRKGGEKKKSQSLLCRIITLCGVDSINQLMSYYSPLQKML